VALEYGTPFFLILILHTWVTLWPFARRVLHKIIMKSTERWMIVLESIDFNHVPCSVDVWLPPPPSKCAWLVFYLYFYPTGFEILKWLLNITIYYLVMKKKKKKERILLKLNPVKSGRLVWKKDTCPCPKLLFLERFTSWYEDTSDIGTLFICPEGVLI
jgi:hypothetical protein